MYVIKAYKMRSAGNRDWFWPSFKSPVNILEWNHFCLSYNTLKRQIKFIHNGHVEVDFVRPNFESQSEDFIPSKWFGPFMTHVS